MFRELGDLVGKMFSGDAAPVPPMPPDVAADPLAQNLRRALQDLTFDDARVVAMFDSLAFKDQRERGVSRHVSLNHATLGALFEAKTCGTLRHPGPQGEDCLPPLEDALTPVGCDDILYEQWPDLESSGLEIFDMMTELNPALAARDVVLMAIVTGDDDQQFLAARLSAVQRYCDAEGYIVGGGVQLMRPEVFW
ncbi:hypothetical protein [Paracoccus sp. (in: a-proteobacteria)]|jgi:hypothetical protein|uniref:hypothetical protein n=1 Tax=Paracoccus sp. TaxID=267 RepID=UPI0035AECF49